MLNVNDDLDANLALPVFAAPMFLVSGPEIVIACCTSGVVGSFPALNQRTSEGFEEWLIEINEGIQKFESETGKKAAPYAVNLIVHKTNLRVQADLALCVKYKVPIVITSLGAVSQLVDTVHSYGGLVFHDIIKKRHAEKAAEAGVDGLICVCTGAGGHAGNTSPFALLSEVRKVFKKTILLAGSISTGTDIASALQMGADYAYMGTRFINTSESRATEEYKQMIIDCEVKDIHYTNKVSGVNANFMIPSLTKAGFVIDDTNANGGDLKHGIAEEAKAWKTIWSAGQGVTSIDNIPSTKELVGTLKNEFTNAIESQIKNTKKYL